ncbi:hypothetical protein J1G43_07750, partial [Cellulomonas sp. zg-ZUI22]|uniref:hypothetical protein n=1 Tax=Cellulomonas sp. zg-ZUI22 TaxID=2816955 RepID=UPI001A94F19A
VGTPALSTVLSCGGTTYVGVGGSLRRLSAGAASAAGLPTLTVDPSVCVGLPGSSVQVTGPVFVRSVGDATLYLASGGQRRAVSSMDTVYALSAGHPLTIVQLERSVLDSMPMAATPLTPGQVVKAQDGPELYLVDGPSTLRHVPTFAMMTELGRSSWTTVTRAQLTGYTVGTPALSTVLSCGGTTYVGVGGSLRRLSAGAASAAGLPTLTVDPSVCVGLPGSSVQVTGPVFVRSVGDATLYLASGGQRRAVSSMDTVYALSAGHPLTIVQLERSVLDSMPTGPGV